MANLLSILIAIIIIITSVLKVKAARTFEDSRDEDEVQSNDFDSKLSSGFFDLCLSDSSSDDEDWNEDRDCEVLMNMSNEISGQFPFADLYFVGTSLSKIGRVLEIKSKFLPTNNTIQYVPFSKNFLHAEKKDDGTIIYHLKPHKMPTDVGEQNYRMLLQKLGLDPESIHFRYTNSSRVTVIADYVYTGEGLASFLYFIHKWAKELNIVLGDALQVLAVRLQRFSKDWNVACFRINGKQEFCINPKVIDTDDDIIIKMMNPEVHGFYERHVPFYPPEDWVNPPPEISRWCRQRVAATDKVLTECVKNYLIRNGMLVLSSTPTLVLRTPDIDLPPIELEVPVMEGHHGACLPPGSHVFKRDLSSNGLKDNPIYLIFTFGMTGENALNREVYITLMLEYRKSRRNKSFVDFVKDELGNPFSTASAILREACDDLYSRYHRYDVIDENEYMDVQVYNQELSNKVDVDLDQKSISERKHQTDYEENIVFEEFKVESGVKKNFGKTDGTNKGRYGYVIYKFYFYGFKI